MRSEKVRGRWRGQTALLVWLCVLVPIYASIWTDAPVLDGDSSQYQHVATDLADGRLDTLHFRTPGYPILLLLTGASSEPSRSLLWVSLGLHALAILLLDGTLRALGASGRWRVLLIGLLSLPLYVEPAAYVMTENLAQFTLVVGLTALIRAWQTGHTGWAILAGLALSYAALVRPIYQALPLVMAGLCVCYTWVSRAPFRRPGLRAAGAMLSTWVLVVIGFALFNHARFGWFGLSPSLGLHLSTKTMSFVERLPDEYAVARELFIRERDRLLVARGGTHTGTQAIWGVRAELKRETGLSDEALSSYLVRMNLLLIRRAPLEYLQEVARSAAVYWFPASGRLASMNSSAMRWLWIGVHGSLVVVLAIQLMVLVAWLAVWVTIRPRPIRVPEGLPASPAAFAYVSALVIVGYTMALSCLVDIGEPRQRRSTDAIFVFACVLGLHAWSRTASPGTSENAALRAYWVPHDTGPPRT